MLSMRKIVLSAAPIVVAALLAGCGGGGGGGTSNLDGTPSAGDGGSGPPAGGGGGVVGFVSGPVGGQVEAATAEPVAGSVTQSSDTENGVTANAVTASVSLDDRGFLKAHVNGGAWQLADEAGTRFRFSGWTRNTVAEELRDGSWRTVYTFSDRTLPKSRGAQEGDIWVSSKSFDNIESFYSKLEGWGPEGHGISGTLNGIPGTLYCADFGCETLSQRPAVAVPGVPAPEFSGNITFSRSDEEIAFRFVSASAAQNPSEDSDYLVLGFWERIPRKYLTTDPPGLRDLFWGDAGFDEKYFEEIEFGVFVDGSDPFRQDRVEALTGTASYEGFALLGYVDTNLTGTDPVSGLAIGKESTLTATATLTAEFGTNIENGTVSGHIHDFRQTIPAEELVYFPYELTNLPTRLTLGSAPIGSSHSGFFKGNTSMTFDGSAFSGKWGGQFYGNDKPHGMPGSTAGTFGAATADGTKSLIGAFGAYKR